MALGLMDIPELAELSPALRRRIFLRFLKRKAPTIAVATMVCVLILGHLFEALGTMGVFALAMGSSVFAALAALVLAAMMLGAFWFFRMALRRAFRDWLRLCIENSPVRGRFVICPQCAYLLTGATGLRCPECGRVVTVGEDAVHDENAT